MHPNFHAYLTGKGSFTQVELAEIDQVSVVKKLRKRQYLLQQGDVWSYNAFVATGCVRTYRVDDAGGVEGRSKIGATNLQVLLTMKREKGTKSRSGEVMASATCRMLGKAPAGSGVSTGCSGFVGGADNG